MSGNHATRRKAGRAKHLAAYRADGRFASLSAFIENERLAAALRGGLARKRYTLKTLQFTGSFDDCASYAMADAAISVRVEEWIARIYASAPLPSSFTKGTLTDAISAISSKR